MFQVWAANRLTEKRESSYELHAESCRSRRQIDGKRKRKKQNVGRESEEENGKIKRKKKKP